MEKKCLNPKCHVGDGESCANGEMNHLECRHFQVDGSARLLITNDTELTQKANMFSTGEDGYFTQEYTLFADDKDTGVIMLVTGNVGKDNAERRFTVNGIDYGEVKEAFEAAGHEWTRSA